MNEPGQHTAMLAPDEYRLVVTSDGRALVVSVEGNADAASGHVREVTTAAQKLGMPVVVQPADKPRSVAGAPWFP